VAIRARHYSSSTEKAYAGWIKRFSTGADKPSEAHWTTGPGAVSRDRGPDATGHWSPTANRHSYPAIRRRLAAYPGKLAVPRSIFVAHGRFWPGAKNV